MRQVVLAAAGELRIEDGPLPDPGRGELRVRAEAVGICGSDLHAFADEHPFIDLPVVPGHEAAGRVDAVGEGVSGFSAGDAVLLEPNLIDHSCIYCRSGRYNLCEHLQVVGCQTSGALADAFVAPAERFHRVPDGMSMAAAALVEPLSTATHAVRVAGELSGASVAVLGAGSIGLLTMLAARSAGAVAIAVTDPIAGKRELARKLGADVIADPTDDGAVERIRSELPHRPDVVFDCVSTQTTIDQAVALALKGGTVVVEGVAHGAATIPLHLVQDRELRLQGTAMYVREDVERAIALIEGGSIPVERLVTRSYPLEQAAEAFRAAAEGVDGDPAVKIQLEPQR
ncbi:MAG: alcohol dehydrogenase catalytic domain-containing protein [Solirubrobacterales bacterium]|nr:alcohol dehydrogenase catalytic domain-containing protein [Solirubrobacterales bacterium]MBV9915060.1 alcohol dehydrogenase catalytic domain-containing protein [Solirubrobacterales bacterium]